MLDIGQYYELLEREYPFPNSNLETIAKLIYSIYDIKAPIEDMNLIINRIGGTVEEISGMSSQIRKSEENGFRIGIPTYVSKVTRNIMAARELGHLFLHMGFLTDSEKWNSLDHKCYYSKSSIEDEHIYEFAEAFLMPGDEFRSFVLAHLNSGIVNVQEVVIRK